MVVCRIEEVDPTRLRHEKREAHEVGKVVTA